MEPENSLEWIEFTRVNGKVTEEKERVVAELPLSICVNGRHFTTAMIMPALKREFVTGHLFSQGIIETADDIRSMNIEGGAADVEVRERRERPCLHRILSDFTVDKEDIYKGVVSILKSDMYTETHAVHSAGLFGRGAVPVCVAEDVGRHNALDKVIGYALMNGVDLSRTFVASTGRMVSDMVTKICRANIPITATKTAVTKSGVEIGSRYGLTIIGFVSDEEKPEGREMKIYTCRERILL